MVFVFILLLVLVVGVIIVLKNFLNKVGYKASQSLCSTVLSGTQLQGLDSAVIQ